MTTPADRGAAIAARRLASGALTRALTATPNPAHRRAARDDARASADTLRRALRAGVTAATAPQLFPTPPALAARLVQIADIRPGHRVLEPSAGTGRLIDAMPAGCIVVAVEISQPLALALRPRVQEVRCIDFLRLTPDDMGAFDRVVMNPPFGQAQDIAHIRHARRFLAPGGRLVALCAAGPRQQAALQPIATTWEQLPPGSFTSEGTGVNVALLTIDAPH